MTTRFLCSWAVILLYCGVLLQACQTAERFELPDVIEPRTFAVPAGGIYRTRPSQIRLLTEAGATIYYRWQGEDERQYTGPIHPPESKTRHVILHYWAQDAAGNREPLRREHYVIEPKAAHVEMLELDRTELGSTDTAVLRWRSTATDAIYEVEVTRSGWGPGQRVAQGQVTPGVVQQTRIPGTALHPGENRLWLRVRHAAGVTGTTSRLLQLHATPTTTYAWPGGGRFGTPQNVWLFTTRTATIYYTTDDSTPTLHSSRYTTPLSLKATTQLRYFSVDVHGNREEPQAAYYEIEAQAPTVVLQSISGFDVGGDTPVVFTWRSDMAGRYDVLLKPPHQKHAVTVQQGNVQRKAAVRNTIARNFLSAGDWQVRVRVQPAQGQAGWLSFRLRVHYLETFADTRYLDTEASAAVWDPTQRHVRLTRGPRLLGTYHTRGRSRQVTGRGVYAYLANSRGGLHIIDVSDPQTPRRAGVFYPHGSAVALAKYRQYVYMAASHSGITVLEVTEPTTPRLVRTIPLEGNATDIAIAAPYAYVGTQQGVLYVFDLTAPLEPRLLGQVAVTGRVVDIAVASDGMVYLACLNQGLNIIDARTPQHPRLIRHWPTRTAATGVAVHDQRVYIAAGALEVLDVRQPETPVRQKSQWLQNAYGVTVVPPYAAVAAGSDGVLMVSMTEARTVQQSPTTHYAARLVLHDRHLLVADTRGGLQILDLTDPTQPRLLAGLDTVPPIVDVVADGHLAYLATDRYGSGLFVVDISMPNAPRVIGRYYNQATTDVVVWNDLALLGDAAGVLQVLDVRQPIRPRLLTSLDIPGKAQRLALLPPYVLVASDRGGVHVVELTQPGMPELRTTVSVPGRALDMALVGRMAYIAAVSGGIQMVDFSSPAQPKFVGAYHHVDGEGDRIIRLIADQQRVYAIDSERGLQILGYAAPGQLQLRGSFAIPKGAPWALTTVGPYVFVTTLLNSLYVVDVTNPVQPRLLSTAPYGGAGVYATGAHLYIAVRGSRGVPGGLRIVETFATVTENTLSHLRPLGASALPGPTPETFRVNRAYAYNAPGVVQSTVISPPDIPVLSARLQVEDFWSVSGRIRYELSSDGGRHWYDVQPGKWLHFDPPGADLRWRATLLSTDLATTPMIDVVRIDYTTPKPKRPDG